MGFDAATRTVAPLIYALDTRRRRLLVQEFRKSYLLDRMMRAGKSLEFQGRVLQVPYYIGGPPMAGRWINSSSILPDPMKSTPVMGAISHRYYAWPQGFNELDRYESENDPNMIIKVADLQAVEAAWGERRLMSQALWNGTGGDEPDGLLATIQAAAPGSQTGSYSGFTRSSNIWQTNNYVEQTANSGHIAAASSVPTILLSLIALFDAALDGTRSPSDAITNLNIMRIVRRALLEIESPYRMLTKREDIDMGHLSINIEGVCLAWDVDCPDDTVIAMHLDDSGKKNSLRVKNNPDDKTDLDTDLEEIPSVSTALDLDGKAAIVRHPNIKDRAIAPRQGAKTLTNWSWRVNSFNLFFPRLRNTARLGSDTGSRLATWS